MIILFWVCMILWLIFEGYETARSKTISSSLAAWLAVAILGSIAV